MKPIFEESTKAGDMPMARVVKNAPQWNDRLGRHDYADTIERWADSIFVSTKAYWDKDLDVIVVDQGLDDYTDLPDSRRILETIYGKAKALRRAIELADEWIALVRSAIPQPLTDDEVLARHKAQEEIR
jgi:hypothetical protein